MEERHIISELEAVSGIDFTVNDIEALLTRTDELLGYIESRPDYRVRLADLYTRAALTKVSLLCGINRYGDAILFADPVFEQIMDGARAEFSDDTLSVVCQSISTLAFCHAQMGNTKQSFDYLHYVSLQLDRLNSAACTVRFYMSMAATYDAFTATDDLSIAIDYGLRAVEVCKDYGLHIYLPIALVNVCQISNVIGEFDQAIGYGQELLTYLEQSKREPHFSRNFYLARTYVSAHSSIGEAWLGKENLKKAEQYYQRASALNTQYGPFSRNTILQLQGLGSVQLKASNFPAAINYLENAVEAADSGDHSAVAGNSCKLLSEAYEAIGDYKRAFIYFDRFHELGLMLRNDSAAVLFEVLQARHRLTTAIAHNEELEQTNLRNMLLNQSLAEKNDKLSVYTNIMSHDLRSPLNVVLAGSEMMGVYAESQEKVKEYLQYIGKSTESINHMLDVLLLYSKADTDIRSQFKLIDLNEVVTEVVSGIQNDLKRLNVDLVIDSLPSVMGDRTLLSAVFQNLISNAIKFQPVNISSHVPSVEISINPSSRNKEIIMVKDNGIGISNDFVGKLFEPFKRHCAKDYEGTGLGLSICKRVLQIHSADIRLESSSDQGSCFQLIFS